MRVGSHSSMIPSPSRGSVRDGSPALKTALDAVTFVKPPVLCDSGQQSRDKTSGCDHHQHRSGDAIPQLRHHASLNTMAPLLQARC